MLLLALLLLGGVVSPPGVVIDHIPAKTARYIGSPSIAILPDGAYVASHDPFGKGTNDKVSGDTIVFRSTDKGKTWQRTAELNDLYWANLFVHRGKLYLMGTTHQYGRIVIRRSTDGGYTWTPPSRLTTEVNYHTAPMPMAVHGGRIWRTMEYHPPGLWGNFEALMLSAPVKSDLLDPASWRFTARLPYPANAGEGKHWLEGNAVVARDGKLLNILRVDNIEKAAVVRVEGDKLVFERLVDFPGGAKKFTIRYDRKSRRYWTLSNPAPGSPTPAKIRNTLALVSSADLREWRTERIVLTHPDPEKHAFQYVDWQFDGADLIATVRTAFDDDQGGAANYHDANYLTFLRVKDFRKTKPSGGT